MKHVQQNTQSALLSSVEIAEQFPSIKESIVSKIDDLGRVLVPKEIRAAMGWSTGDNLQIVCNPTDGTIAFKSAED